MASCPLSANQRANSDLPERGGPVSTAVRNGQLSGWASASATCAFAGPMTMRDGPVLAGASGRTICVTLRASARDAERAAALVHLPSGRAQRGGEAVDVAEISDPQHRSAADRGAADGDAA